jgi:hypothetical protein
MKTIPEILEKQRRLTNEPLTKSIEEINERIAISVSKGNANEYEDWWGSAALITSFRGVLPAHE